MSQEAQTVELGIKLETAEQQLAIIGLENAEYKKEINELKQRNEDLMNENGWFVESAKREKQTVSYLQSISEDMDAVSVYNANLNSKVSQYQKSLKILTSSNEYLQKENAKYKAKLETLIQKTQRKHAIYMDNVSILESKIRELQHECDTLRDDHANTLNVLQTVSDSGSDEKQFEPPPECEDKSSLLRIKLAPYASINHHHMQMMRSPLQSDCELDITTPIIYSNDEVKIPFTPIAQSTRFGYTEDIIGELSTSNELEVPCDSSKVMVSKLKEMNRKKEHKIQKLVKHIKLLQKKNDALSKRNNKSCIAWVWTK
eukprot:109071_1